MHPEDPVFRQLVDRRVVVVVVAEIGSLEEGRAGVIIFLLLFIPIYGRILCY